MTVWLLVAPGLSGADWLRRLGTEEVRLCALGASFSQSLGYGYAPSSAPQPALDKGQPAFHS